MNKWMRIVLVVGLAVFLGTATLLPAQEDEPKPDAAPADEAPAPHFALTAKIARRNNLALLSMGMSADFATAIAFGATHVRLGSAIFGSLRGLWLP